MDFKKKLYFDRDGNFIREEFYDEQIIYSDLVFLENGELIINNSPINLEPNLAIYHNDKLVMSEIPFDANMDDSPLNRRSIISRIDDNNYLLSLGLRDTIYKVDIDGYQLEPAYMMDFQNEISFSKFSELQNPLQYFMENDFYVGAIDLFQNTDFLSFSTLHSTGLKGRIFSKDTGKTYSTKELIHQKGGDVGFEEVLGITPNNEFVAVLSTGDKGKWDFSINPFLEKQFNDFAHVDKEELILLIFDLDY